jgi:hypothetical protein
MTCRERSALKLPHASANAFKRLLELVSIGSQFHDSSDNQIPLADSSNRDPVGIDLKARDLTPTTAEKPEA